MSTGIVYAVMEQKDRSFDVVGQLASLRRYAHALTRGKDSEDLVHEALLRAYEKKRNFRQGSNLKAWLMSILHNVHVDHRRRNLSLAARDSVWAEESQTAVAAGQEHTVRLAQIRQAFLSLPEDQREALHLVTIEDLSYQEAADALGIPVGTLMSRISRARAWLRAFEEGKQEKPALRLVGGSNHDDR